MRGPLLAVALLGLGLSGCPERDPPPIFDAPCGACATVLEPPCVDVRREGVGCGTQGTVWVTSLVLGDFRCGALWCDAVCGRTPRYFLAWLDVDESLEAALEPGRVTDLAEDGGEQSGPVAGGLQLRLSLRRLEGVEDEAGCPLVEAEEDVDAPRCPQDLTAPLQDGLGAELAPFHQSGPGGTLRYTAHAPGCYVVSVDPQDPLDESRQTAYQVLVAVDGAVPPALTCETCGE